MPMHSFGEMIHFSKTHKVYVFIAIAVITHCRRPLSTSTQTLTHSQFCVFNAFHCNGIALYKYHRCTNVVFMSLNCAIRYTYGCFRQQVVSVHAAYTTQDTQRTQNDRKIVRKVFAFSTKFHTVDDDDRTLLSFSYL